jgi:hypothetical protein
MAGAAPRAARESEDLPGEFMNDQPRSELANTPAAPRRLSTDARYEIVFENSLTGGGTLASVVAVLRSLGGRGGSAIGNAYVRAARAFSSGKERIEDLNAERRFRERANRTRERRPASGTTPGVTPGPQTPLPRK